MSGSSARTVVREDRFESEQLLIVPDAAWMDEQVKDPEALLSHFPRFGLQTIAPAVWIAPVIVGLKSGGHVEADIFYTFDHDTVRFLSIRKV